MPTFPSGCALHRAGPVDLAAYAAFSRATFSDTYRASHSADALARHVAHTFRDDLLRQELDRPERAVLAVREGDAWVGYAVVECTPAPPCVRAQRPVEIARFYVTAAWHGRGLAAPLMAAALDEAQRQGGDMAWLSVWEQNPRAIQFYARQGFAPVGRATYLFDAVPEDDIVVAVALSR